MTHDRIQDWIGMWRVPVYTAAVALYMVAQFVETAPVHYAMGAAALSAFIVSAFFARGVYQVSGALFFAFGVGLFCFGWALLVRRVKRYAVMALCHWKERTEGLGNYFFMFLGAGLFVEMLARSPLLAGLGGWFRVGAKKISLAKSTTTRLLATLEQNRLVVKDPETLKYRLGQGLYYLGYIAGKSIKVREIARPVMERLRDETRETVNLYVLEQDARVCVEQCEGLQALRHMVRIGERLPLWAGAGGKVLLAYQSPEVQERIFAQVPTKERLDRLAAELEVIRERGVASSIDEREVGSAAVAAPIFDIRGEVGACLSVSGPAHRFTREVMEQFERLVKEGAQAISEKLGYRP